MTSSPAGPVRVLAQSAPDQPHAERLLQAFVHAPLAMALVGPDDRVLSGNPAMCRLTGYTADELVATTLADLAHPDERAAGVAARRAVLARRTPSSAVETRLLRPDGRTLWVSLSCAATGDDDTPLRQLVVQMVDITEQKRVEDELTRSNVELGSFAYLAAHELKSPLQALSGFAALLDRVHGPQLDPQAREFVGWIVDGVNRMDALIEDLLTYCSVDTAEPVLAPVDLREVVADALAQVEHEVAERGALVSVDVLPVVTGDPVQVGQLVQNLLVNALKFVPEGRPPQVHISAERDGEAWTVTVADNGIGVEVAARDRIFTMFQRLHPRERYKGTGIGLSICKRIVERRGGSIWVEANPTGGSRFRFRLPDLLAPASSVSAA